MLVYAVEAKQSTDFAYGRNYTFSSRLSTESDFEKKLKNRLTKKYSLLDYIFFLIYKLNLNIRKGPALIEGRFRSEGLFPLPECRPKAWDHD